MHCRSSKRVFFADPARSFAFADPALLTMAVVGKAAAAKTSQWDTKKHIAYSHVAHLGVDNVLFALVSGVDSLSLLNASLHTYIHAVMRAGLSERFPHM